MQIFATIKWLYATFIILLGVAFMIAIFPIVKSPRSQKIASNFIALLTGITALKEGKEDSEAQMFLLNHESDIDIGCMETTTKRNLAWVAKKELFDIPFFGLALKWPDDIAVERESKTSLIKLLKDAKERLDQGRVLTIFPEGTRSQTGKMRSFKPGAKMIADKYGLKVQPVVLVNTASYYNIKTKHYKPGKIKVIYMEPFIAEKKDKEWLNNVRVKMQEVYDNELANISSYR